MEITCLPDYPSLTIDILGILSVHLMCAVHTRDVFHNSDLPTVQSKLNRAINTDKGWEGQVMKINTYCVITDGRGPPSEMLYPCMTCSDPASAAESTSLISLNTASTHHTPIHPQILSLQLLWLGKHHCCYHNSWWWNYDDVMKYYVNAEPCTFSAGSALK